jgi:isopenicillin-N epimerase
MRRATRDDFLLDPTIVFLNHGSFGATPNVVQQEYHRLQLAMERNPVEWLGRRADNLMEGARARLGDFVGTHADNVVFFPNPTTAINMVVGSLALSPGDEVLTTDHEYGAMTRTWRRYTAAREAQFVEVPIPLPVTTADDFVERVWSRVTSRTKVLFLSHLTSATALAFPVHELCRRAREAGILSIIDGAHVPAHLPLHLDTLGADIYTGALHKWLCAPKGCSFLFARPEVQPLLEPLVVSWGWDSDHPGPSAFIDRHEWQGTRDLSAFLAVGAALDFALAHDLPESQRRAHLMALDARRRINALTGVESVSPEPVSPESVSPEPDAAQETHQWIGQMVAVRLPAQTDTESLKERLFDEHRIEVPVHLWNGTPLIRVSCAAHNEASDIDALLEALAVLLPGSR